MKRKIIYLLRQLNHAVKSVVFWINRLSIVKHILFYYFAITLIGTFILWTSWAQQGSWISKNGSVSFIDCLFTASSAFSDTGLVSVPTAATWSYFGQAIIAILIFSGGVGFFALKVYIFNIIFGRPMGMFSRNILTTERGSAKIGQSRHLIKVSVTAMIVLVLIGTFALLFYFYYVQGDFSYNGPGTNTIDYSTGNIIYWNNDPSNPNNDTIYSPYHNWSNSIRFALFHSISALNNAGFDIMGTHSIAPYYTDYYLQFVLLFLLIMGGIGFPVIYDVYMFFRTRIIGKPFKFSLFTKLSCLTYLIISILGISLVFIFELTIQYREGNGRNVSFWNNAYNGNDWQKSIALIFNTMSTRNAGFATINVHNFSNQTLFLQGMLMFIGSAPSSTAGGIRTTTCAIIILGLWKYVRNRNDVRVFNRRISLETVNQSFAVLSISMLIIAVGVMVLSTSYDNLNGKINPQQFNFIDLFYEVCSAFGTTGLSTGLTSQINTASKLTLSIIMFIGQLGVSSTLLVWGNKKQALKRFQFIQEDVQIG